MKPTVHVYSDTELPQAEQISASGPDREIALLLIENGIHPYNVPSHDTRPDAVTADGYLHVTGEIIGNEIQYRREPWLIADSAVQRILEIATRASA